MASLVPGVIVLCKKSKMCNDDCLITESDNYDALNSKTRYESHRGGADARGRVPSRV